LILETNGENMTQTISLLEQIKASRALRDAALSNIEGMTDAELRLALSDSDGASNVDRVLSIASDNTVDRVLSIASDNTVDRVLSIASDNTVDRVLSIASDNTVARVLSIASDNTVDRVLSIASASTVARFQAIKALTVPVVADLDKRMLEAAEAGNLRMDRWHCGTTHCRAGWAVIFGGDEGAKLEEALGSETAGRLIYEASTGRMAPDFFASNEAAIADIRRCAGVAA
jgi:hypothetical protein